MTKIAQKFAKNRKRLLSLEGGGVLQNSTWFSRGVGQKTMSVHKGGRGGQKCPKFRPHGLWMTPCVKISLMSGEEKPQHQYRHSVINYWFWTHFDLKLYLMI